MINISIPPKIAITPFWLSTDEMHPAPTPSWQGDLWVPSQPKADSNTE